MKEWKAGAGAAALCDLQWHWGEAYQITRADGTWLARRRDNGRLPIAQSAHEQRDLIVADYTAPPVQREHQPVVEAAS